MSFTVFFVTFGCGDAYYAHMYLLHVGEIRDSPRDEIRVSMPRLSDEKPRSICKLHARVASRALSDGEEEEEVI